MRWSLQGGARGPWQQSITAMVLAAPVMFAGAAVLAPGAASQEQPKAAPRAVNLKVLPKETPLPQVYARMAQMQHDLGVGCSFCHDADPDTKQIDYASDENPRKETARTMMRMTDDINTKYLAYLGDRRESPPVTCGNCHLGQMHPPPFEGAGREGR